MSGAENYVISGPDLLNLTTEIFVKAGLGREDAGIAAGSLVEANLRGTDSHGVIRVENYIKRLKHGGAAANVKCRLVSATPATIVLDAENGLGAVASRQVCGLVRDKALKNNLAFGVVRNSNHFGAASMWALLLAGDDLISFVGSNVHRLMPAPGGKGAAIGNNPFALAVPAGRYEPMCLDMACSVVAQGNVLKYRHDRRQMPEGWFVDSEGEPTTDPFEALMVLPFGGHKGFGIAVIVEMLSALLAGGAFADNIGSQYDDLVNPNRLSHFFGAMRIDAFRDLGEFKSDVDEFIDKLKAVPKKAGVAEIFYPGEIEAARKKANLKSGIKLPRSIVEELSEIAAELKVEKTMIAPLTARPV
ncbi:MAG: Ldh family oxidoreductase [Candidatus Adiutrix sp.]|jgi:ureidoglycolate dehydrogenase (NAD+)|nr:Ldh family oxidoreductase [Candidatus Adiutrix sp.]